MKTINSTIKQVLPPLLFLLLTWPGSLNYVMHFPDEKHYTDAAIHMIETGDLLTPTKHDYTPRFKKPIITYWVILASYKLFGISQFSSRVFFWLAGALVVLITYLMVRSITGDEKKAWVAGLVMMANPLLILSASRSIPDVLLVLFLSTSAWGFLSIMVNKKPAKKYFWMAYLGAALAFETKGLPALAFTGASILFLVLNPWKRKKLKEVFEPVSLLVSILVALSWFIAMYAIHGATYLQSFLGDQVGERVSFSLLIILANIGLSIVTLFAFFIPWGFPLAPFSLKLGNKLSFMGSNKEKAVTLFIIVWILLIFIVSGFVFKFYDRYVLPVFPLVSFLIASIITGKKQQFFKPATLFFIIANLLVVLINLFFFVFFKNSTIVLPGILLAVTLAAYFIAKKPAKKDPVGVLAVAMALLLFNANLLLMPITLPVIGTQVVDSLEKHSLDDGRKIYFYGYIGKASQIRIESQGELDVVSMDKNYMMPDTEGHILVFPQENAGKLDLNGYKIVMGSEAYSKVELRNNKSFLSKYIIPLKKGGEKFIIAYK